MTENFSYLVQRRLFLKGFTTSSRITAQEKMILVRGKTQKRNRAVFSVKNRIIKVLFRNRGQNVPNAEAR